MHLQEKTVKSDVVYEGPIFTITHDIAELENGKNSVRDVLHHHGGVCVVPVTENNEIYLVRQFRYPFAAVTTEVPAGKLEKGEDIKSAALRELKEETGLSAKKITYLGEMYTTPALIDEIIHLYIAEDLSSGEQSLDEDEFINVEKMSLEAAVKKVLSGEIKDSKTQTIVLRAAFATGLAERK